MVDLKPWDDTPESAVQMVDIDDTQYFKEYPQYMSASKLKVFADDPMKYVSKYIDGDDPPRDSSAMLLGSATHCYILEGMKAFNARYNVADGPINPKTDKPYGKATAKYAAWLDEQPEGLDIISTAEHTAIVRMGLSVQGHNFAPGILTHGNAEQAVRGKLQGVDCQSKIDWLNLHGVRPSIVDLKTTATLDRFKKHQIWDFGYDLQAGFYSLMIQALTGQLPTFDFVAVETVSPYRTRVVHIGCIGEPDCSVTLEQCMGKATDQLRSYRHAAETETWHGKYRGSETL